ncbi:MAG: hypothetical protein HY899_08210 [Deltaproteobacteria bacterium]|nr:hypothetical protein [Deltaproteobacteria bacterium]
MCTIVRPLAVVLGLLVSAVSAWAQSPADHLQCFRIKDAATRALYKADLAPTDPIFPLASGCTVRVPARLLCVDVVKSNVTPAPPGSPEGEAARPYLCYKTTCPKAQPTTNVSDQFGVHAVHVTATGLLCAPVDVPTPTTTVASPTCTDGIQNGTETDLDCGSNCPPCAVGQNCALDSDCTASFCLAGTCTAPSCTDGITNGTETDIDCGGTCPTCGLGQQCLLAADCTSGVCSLGTCAASCTDGIQDGSETDVDCGGGTCPTCALGQQCLLVSDCTSGACSGGVCVALTADGGACSFAGQCQSGFCVDGVCCNTACSGLCQACIAAKNGSGTNGSCGNIVPASDPDSECTEAGASTCSTNGMCSGTGSCALYPGGTVCSTASCSGGIQTLAGQCDGVGTCNPGATTACTPYICGPTACKKNCLSGADCDIGFNCSAGTCQ